MLEIRPETAADSAAVRLIHEAAFETSAEANLVNSLRERADPLISLVAGYQGEITGHVLFSPVTLKGHPDLKLMGLAPMAVRPEYQRRGTGSQLVRAGLQHCRDAHVTAVVVLGHPEFYSKFGFVPASQFGLCCEYEVPDEAFMVLELQPDGLSERTGTVQYHAAFKEL